jgi:hypothetical protein
MRQNLFMVGGGIIVLGLVVCGLWGSPRHIAPKAQIRQELNVDPDLKLVTERSPYMRSER